VVVTVVAFFDNSGTGIGDLRDKVEKFDKF
jgi:hypothetical protein